MKFLAKLTLLAFLASDTTQFLAAALPLAQGSPVQVRLSLNDKLESRIPDFDTAGLPLLEVMIDLAFKYELPMGIEYASRDAISRPINMRFHDDSLRTILKTVVGQVPYYAVDFSGAVVHVYSQKAREDPSNLLNRVIRDFSVEAVDTRDADLELVCALSRELDRSSMCGGSIAKGQWGPLKITLHLTNVRVYQVLDAIAAQNGKAIWSVIAPPSRLVGTASGDLWHIYPLEAPFKGAVLEKLSTLK